MESPGNKVNNETPKKHENSAKSKTPICTPKNFKTRFFLLSNNQNSFTPSPSLRVVRNPFENQHDRLHLPVISSPSLFHTLTTPKRNSQPQFEWTIEELSELNPVNMVAHETQFREEEDPEREAKAQAAISSFFTEQKIVPSPHDCQLRNQKIILKDDENSMKIVNSTALISANKKDTKSVETASQTLLSFPPTLPKEVEDLLKKYQIIEDEGSPGEEWMDISTLRRKLFINRPESPEPDIPDESFGVHLSPPPRTPELRLKDHVSDCNNQDESFGSDMFGELSPIRKCSSPAVCFSNDVSMMSDSATPSRGLCRNKLKKGKVLSESFCLLQNEFEDEDLSEKENTIKELVMTEESKTKQPKRFGRFDSGFPEEDSKLSADYMQF